MSFLRSDMDALGNEIVEKKVMFSPAD